MDPDTRQSALDEVVGILDGLTISGSIHLELLIPDTLRQRFDLRGYMALVRKLGTVS